ncbi:MAG TPA: L,D-transpeptidase family protein [Longimicrobium sp.]|jgi:lipoprotein-anchoring transpeptidase ErfK/SrfK|uniref:L,D-transpeptidase family protein n=1 Tax=Longimicrobium sp. TaxID=2029185 RepID=UPI002EDA8EE8
MHLRLRVLGAALAAAAAHVIPVAAQTQPATPPPATNPATPAQPPRGLAPRPTGPAQPAPVVRRPSVLPVLSVRVDSTVTNAGRPPERWDQLTAAAANSGTYRLPVGRGHSGPSVLRAQVLLNRSLFSAGMLDGVWGRNTENAVLWFQGREGLPRTGVVDSATYARLVQTAGADSITVARHVLTAEDVRGPFVTIPTDIYQHARLSCSCYESLSEKLSERFQTGRQLLRKLNPGMNLDSVEAGDTLSVPAVRAPDARAAGEVAQIVVSGTDNYAQALDSGGRILYYFAATLGASYDPSPDGDFYVLSIHENPWWNYQPRILASVPDDRPSAMIPPGPNSSVGRVWMALSAPHYGIHGTKSPETIGYAQSAGCVRLTNWDALFLSRRITPGTPVSFRDTRAGSGPRSRTAPAARDTARPAAPATASPAPRDTVRRTAPARDSTHTRPATPAAAPRDTAHRAAPAHTPAPARDSTPAHRPAVARPAQPAARDTARAQ